MSKPKKRQTLNPKVWGPQTLKCVPHTLGGELGQKLFKQSILVKYFSSSQGLKTKENA